MLKVADDERSFCQSFLTVGVCSPIMPYHVGYVLPTSLVRLSVAIVMPKAPQSSAASTSATLPRESDDAPRHMRSPCRGSRWSEEKNSLFRQKHSLFARKNSLSGRTREYGCNALELLRELTSGTVEMAANLQIPCYFPCSQGFVGGADPRRLRYSRPNSRLTDVHHTLAIRAKPEIGCATGDTGCGAVMGTVD